MPKSYHQKLKLLYLRKFLFENSDEDHPVSVAEMIAALDRVGIRAERKSIYEDLRLLQEFGDDIIMVRGKCTGYYVGERSFELPELKLLVDSVQSSKFITQSKTVSLIHKIESLSSKFDARKLHRQVYVRGRVKTMNESVFYNVDAISEAIGQNRPILFQYFEYLVSGERKLKHNGKQYHVSPYALIWDDENYYLLGWDHESAGFKHFRVDKMVKIQTETGEREGHAEFEKLDMSRYTVHVFDMFSGDEQRVQLRFSSHLIGAVMDRFGKDCIIVPGENDTFTVSVTVSVSPHFFGWLISFGTDAEILSPKEVRNRMQESLADLQGIYFDEK